MPTALNENANWSKTDMTEYVAGQVLDTHVGPVRAVHPNDTRVPADIGISDWSGDTMALADGAGREVVAVAPPVRAYIIGQKELAATHVAADPVLASLKNTWTEFEAAAKSTRERYTAERAQIAAERRFTPPPGTPVIDQAGNVVEGPTAPAHRALGVRDAVVTERARAEITQALATQLEAKLKVLTELERTVRAELDDPPSWRPTAEDMAAVLELRQSLQLLTPQYAIPILMRQLVLDPATRGKGQGKVTALLPIVQSLMQRDAVERDRQGLPEYGYASYAVEDIVTQARAIQRDSSYYANHQKLRAIHMARFKLGELARDYANSIGTVGGAARGRGTARESWFKEFGVPAPKEAEAKSPYLGELG
jgi:hypothetical protein